MSFKPRRTAPDSNNLYYIKKESGGYNPCIYGYRSNRSVLPNCFTGDTKIQTERGIFPLKKLVGLDIRVPTMDGVLREATVEAFGKQKIYEVYLDNGSVYKCTSNHRWIIYEDNRKDWKIVETIDLVSGMAIKYSKYNLFTLVNRVVETKKVKPVFCVVEPETHMMTLENGELTGNCVGYAHGRFMEIMGVKSCKLSTHDAKTWYGYTHDGYARGKTPRLGAVICWSQAKWGHVAIVEVINSDGSIITSNSAWPSGSATNKNGIYWYEKTLKPPYSFGSYTFQGFIYNPGAGSAGTPTNKVSDFVSTAKSHVSDGVSFTSSTMGPWKPNERWSMKFVNACAEKNGLLGKAIPKATSPSDLGNVMNRSGIGSWIDWKKAPEPGDILMLRTNLTRTYSNQYDCDKVAIVTEYKKNQIYVVEGDCGGKVQIKSYQHGDKGICAYFRPNWSAVQDSSADADMVDMFGDYGTTPQLYTTVCTKEDAIMRQFGYVSDDYTMTTKKSGIRLSVINYTTPLATGAIGGLSTGLDLSALPGSSNTDVILDDIENQNCRIVIQFLLSKGLNAAASVGIAANIQHESTFNTTSKGDYKGGVPTSFGICQWHFERGTAMKKMCNGDWENNLSGQLNYLWYELNNGYKTSVLQRIVTVPNNEQGAREAADIFVRKFEIPANINSESASRQNTASSLWRKIGIQIK